MKPCIHDKERQQLTLILVLTAGFARVSAAHQFQQAEELRRPAAGEAGHVRHPVVLRRDAGGDDGAFGMADHEYPLGVFESGARAMCTSIFVACPSSSVVSCLFPVTESTASGVTG